MKDKNKRKDGYIMYNYNSYRPNIGAQITGLKGRPVSSLDEVRASAVDFDGTISYFPDLANQKIYTKQINPDGSALLQMYELKELPQTQTTADYITRDEFNSMVEELRKTLNQLEVEKEFKF